MLGVFPILYTFFLSLTRYSGIRPPVLIGIANYQRMAADPLFLKSAYNTLYYTLLAVPIGVVVAMGLALAMNRKVREVVGLSRDLLPAVDPAGLRHLVHLRGPAQPGLRARQLGAVVGRAAVPELARAILPTRSSRW